MFLVSFAGLATSLLHHGYLVNYYNAHRSVFVNDSMILELTNRFLTDDPKDNFVSCNVIVTTSASRRIHMHFLSLEISYDDDSVDRYVLFLVSLVLLTVESELKVDTPCAHSRGVTSIKFKART